VQKLSHIQVGVMSVTMISPIR